MPMRPFLNPSMIGVELVYTLIIVALCLFVYLKTRGIYSLTKYSGIKYFRNAFLFFGLAYALRLLLHSMLIGMTILDVFIPGRMILPLSNVFVAYFSTMALFYLVYSTVWKKIKYRNFLVLSHASAIAISVVAFMYRSHHLVLLLQLVLFMVAFFTIFWMHRKNHIFSRSRVLYLLLFIFWLLNLSVLGPRKFIPFEAKVIMQMISIIIFMLIYHKVSKWTK